MSVTLTRTLGAALVLSLGASLAGCGGMATNRSLYSTKQPVVQRHSYVIDVATLPDGSERAAPEYEDCARLAREHNVPLQRVMQAAQSAALRFE